MPVQLVVAVTDREWFEHLRSRPEITEVNFWSPGSAPFRALEEGELFFFKLHAPHNYIAGFGIFAHSNGLPLRSCPRWWCRSAGSLRVSGGSGRFCQAATAGSLTKGSSLNGAMVSSVM